MRSIPSAAASLAIVVVTTVGVAASARSEGAPVLDDTEDVACAVLKRAIARRENLTRPDESWYCEFSSVDNEYIRIVSLRSNRPRDDGSSIYSNLVGHYAVARRSPLVMRWDVAEDRLLALDTPDE